LWAVVSAGYQALLSSSYFERINDDDDDDDDDEICDWTDVLTNIQADIHTETPIAILRYSPEVTIHEG